ncbi:hypothetical protein AB4212_12710 [Streptomyces sp. 2MCAF27]
MSTRTVVTEVETFPLEAQLPDGGYGASKVRLPVRVATLVKRSPPRTAPSAGASPSARRG